MSSAVKIGGSPGAVEFEGTITVRVGRAHSQPWKHGVSAQGLRANLTFEQLNDLRVRGAELIRVPRVIKRFKARVTHGQHTTL